MVLGYCDRSAGIHPIINSKFSFYIKGGPRLARDQLSRYTRMVESFCDRSTACDGNIRRIRNAWEDRYRCRPGRTCRPRARVCRTASRTADSYARGRKGHAFHCTGGYHAFHLRVLFTAFFQLGLIQFRLPLDDHDRHPAFLNPLMSGSVALIPIV